MCTEKQKSGSIFLTELSLAINYILNFTNLLFKFYTCVYQSICNFTILQSVLMIRNLVYEKAAHFSLIVGVYVILGKSAVRGVWEIR